MNKLNCTLEVMAASGSYQPIPNPPDPYFAFWDAVEKGKAPPSGPRSRELKETCLGPAPKSVVPTTAALPTAAEVCGKGACKRDLGDDWAAKHVREFMSNFYDRLMCPLEKSEILPSEADLLNDTAVRNVGDYRLRDNTHMVSGHHHQVLNGVVGVPMPQRPSIKLLARGNDRALVQINHTNSKKGEYFVFYKAHGESKYKAQSCGGEQDSNMCVIDKLKPSACYSFRGALYDGDIRDQLWSGWTEYVPVRTCKSRAQFTTTAQATITFGGIDRSEFNAKVNTTEKHRQSQRAAGGGRRLGAPQQAQSLRRTLLLTHSRL